jgi:3-phosphoshikimate 1-carboxyvinyltransferase
VKETDRISAMANELRKFGARVQEARTSCASSPPGFHAHAHLDRRPVPSTPTRPRMAMCFSLAAFGPRPVLITRSGLRREDFPPYFEEFGRSS